MTINFKYLLLFGVFSSLLIFLFVGEFYDHHGDKAFFINPKPNLLNIFSQNKKKQVSINFNGFENSIEEISKQKILYNKMERESEFSFFIAFILIQLSIMFFISGIFSFLKKSSFYVKQLIVQFLINIPITFIAVSLYLFIDDPKIFYTYFLGLAITNYLTIIIYRKLSNQ